MNTQKQVWFVFCNGQVLIEKQPDGYHVPAGENPPVALPEGNGIHHIGEINGLAAQAYAIGEPVEGDAHSRRRMMDLRASFDVLPPEEYRMAGKASQILTWEKNSRYCPACGVPTVPSHPTARRCPRCGQEFYPRISPAVIVLIRKGDSILLVHARNFRGSFKGLVAGFLEPGETLEECVHREVMEETGLRIKNLTYFGSQPWPYPSGIMVGFHADYAGGTIKLQDEELNAGSFFTRDNLPEIPKKLSIARKLIDAWLEHRI